jgi:hypothetical protein
MQGYEVILKTGRIYDLEMACHALEISGVPFVKQEESYSCIKTGYVQPVMGPGTFFNLLVPTSQKENATEIISQLPIELNTEADFYHFGNNEKTKRVWRIVALVILGVSTVLLLANIYRGIFN